MDVIRTRLGIRLSQHDVVLSEVRTSPGPTHSVFDVLAGLIAILNPIRRVGILGFAAGGMVAPLRALGVDRPICGVDLESTGYQLFQKHCGAWAGDVSWRRADAVAWLRRQPADFEVLVDDLSVPMAGDVFKPAISWDVLPALIRDRLCPGGIAVFNLLPPADRTWSEKLHRLVQLFRCARMVELDEFENRIVLAADSLPQPRMLSSRLRQQLRRIRSRQARRIHLRNLRGQGGTAARLA